jgi:hypothetical protein
VYLLKDEVDLLALRQRTVGFDIELKHRIARPHHISLGL